MARDPSSRLPSSDCPRDCSPQQMPFSGGSTHTGQAQALQNPAFFPAGAGDWGSGRGRDDRRRQSGDRSGSAAHNPLAV